MISSEAGKLFNLSPKNRAGRETGHSRPPIVGTAAGRCAQSTWKLGEIRAVAQQKGGAYVTHCRIGVNRAALLASQRLSHRLSVGGL